MSNPTDANSSEIARRIRERMEGLRDKNKKVEVSLHAPIAEIKKDTHYLKLAVYGLGTALLLTFGVGWQLFLHVDDKIDSKVDYLNARIDNLFASKEALSLMQFNSPPKKDGTLSTEKKLAK